MRQEKCFAGHFYDADRFQSCPVCAKMEPRAGAETDHTVPLSASSASGFAYAADVTMSLNQGSEGTVTRPLNFDPQSMNDSDKTIGVYSSISGVEPVVGWLVNVSGSASSKGTDYRLIAGRNFIGRDKKMSVSITDDNSISREKHAIIVFEPVSCAFFAQPGESSELFYLNGRVVLETTPIKSYDVLRLGETDLMFIPCCCESFNWKA